MDKGRILIVEDETLIAMELKDRLEQNHYTVCGMVARGEEAIEQVEQFKPDLALMDIHLAGKLNGIETAKQLQLKKAIPVIYLTAYSDPRLVEQAAKTEPYGYLVKPFEERELRAMIEVAIYKHMMEKRERDKERDKEPFQALDEGRLHDVALDKRPMRPDADSGEQTLTICHSEQPQCGGCGQAAVCMFSSIASSGITTPYQAGTEIIQKFMPNTGVHVVCAGAVALSEAGVPHNSLMLDVVLPGGILGIVECSLDLRRYHFSARALIDSVVTFFPQSDVRRLCADYAGEMKVLAAVSQAFRRLERRYVLLGAAEASDRLIATLLWLSGMDKTSSDQQATIPFELTSTTLSSLIGARSETVTRLMNQFRAEDLISYSDGRIVITDRENLKARSSLDLNRLLIDPMMS